jgi:hypothetical protein
VAGLGELDRSVDLGGNPPPPAQTALLIHPARNLAEATATSSRCAG